MKKHFLLILILLLCKSFSMAQNSGWQSLSTVSIDDKFSCFELDPQGNAYLLKFSNALLKLNEKKVEEIAGDDSHRCYDGSGGYYYYITQGFAINAYQRDYHFEYYSTLIYWKPHSRQTVIIPYTDHAYFILGAPDWKGNLYLFHKEFYNFHQVLLKKWDGKKWNVLDYKSNANSILPYNRIKKVCTDSSGNLIVAGNFQSSHGAKHHFAKYNGNSWIELGTKADKYRPDGEKVYSIMVDKNNSIYAAGKFNDKGQYYVAKWDGTSWTKLGTGSSSLNANGAINSIALDKDGNVYAAGEFTNKQHKYYVAKWDGSSWKELGNGTDALNANRPITSICVNSNNTVFAVGQFTNASNKNYIAIYKQN